MSIKVIKSEIINTNNKNTVYSDEVIGFENQGNTCYLNTLLQVLFLCEETFKKGNLI
jgi:ubiquitin C-terminal hydrolase